MTTILVLGAGRSSSSLIHYLLDKAHSCQWNVVVGDVSVKAAEEKIQGHLRGKAAAFDIHEVDKSDHLIKAADIIVSLLPAHLHPLVAVKCLEHRKHLLNASYVSEEMKVLHDEESSKGLLFLN